MSHQYLFFFILFSLVEFCPGFDLDFLTFSERNVEPAGEYRVTPDIKRAQSGISCGSNVCLGTNYCCAGLGNCYNPSTDSCCADGTICHSCKNHLGQCCSANVSSCPSESHPDRRFCSSNGCTEGYKCGSKFCHNQANCCVPSRRLGISGCYDPVNEICCASGQSCSMNKCLHIPADGQCCSVTPEVYRFCPNPHGNTRLNRCNPDGTETCVSPETASTSVSSSSGSNPNKKAILMGVLLSVGVAFCFLFLIASFRMRYLYGTHEEVPPVDEEAGKDETDTILAPPKYEEVLTAVPHTPPSYSDSAPPPYVPLEQNDQAQRNEGQHNQTHTNEENHDQTPTNDDQPHQTRTNEEQSLVNQQ